MQRKTLCAANVTYYLQSLQRLHFNEHFTKTRQSLCRKTPTEKLAFITASDIFAASDSPNITPNRLKVSLYVKPPDDNPLCSDLVTVRRRKREASTTKPLAQEVLIDILKASNK